MRGDSPRDPPATPRPWPGGPESHRGGRKRPRGTPQLLLRRLRLPLLSLPLPAPSPSSQIGRRAGDRGPWVPAVPPAQPEQQRRLPGASRRRDRPDARGRERRQLSGAEHTSAPVPPFENHIP
nr:translation initiation factor IF-2-like [Pongo pygmaeus]